MDHCELDDPETHLNCATAVHQICKVESCRQVVVNSGIIRHISKLAIHTEDPHVQEECARALCHLSCVSGAERVLVEQDAVSALSMLMKENLNIAPTCEWTLLNLICVDQSYAAIDRVLKTFLGLATSCSTRVKDVCSSALYRLALLEDVCPVMIEEGVIQIMNTLSRSVGVQVRTKLCFTAFFLSQHKSCRNGMVAKGKLMMRMMIEVRVDT